MQQAERLGFEGRRARLAPLIDATYDLAFVVEIIFAPRWDELDAEATRRCLEVFTRLTVATYAARFDGYAGETFETLSEQRMNSGRIHVRTQLSQVDGDRIQLDYVLRDVDGDARIVNVVADGVSDLALKRAEYAAVMQTDGLDGLLARLEAQTAAYTAEGAPPASG